MPGFEVIVRPVILPDIRPQQARVLAPEADPARSIAILSGAGGKLIDLTESESTSRNSSKATETKRKFNKERIYHKDEQGKVDKGQFIDVERTKTLWTVDDSGLETETTYADPPKRDNVEVLEKDQVRSN